MKNDMRSEMSLTVPDFYFPDFSPHYKHQTNIYERRKK